MYKLDTPRLVSKWRADGNPTGKTFGSSEEAQSKAMKQHLFEARSLFFLLSKEGALASYIRDSEGAYCTTSGALKSNMALRLQLLVADFVCVYPSKHTKGAKGARWRCGI